MRGLRATKYGNTRTFGPTGRLLDSKAEADRAGELELLQTAGEITELEYQPKVTLPGGITYRPDFAYDERGRRVWEDVKGAETAVFRLKAKLWKTYGPGPLRIVKRRGRRAQFTVVRTICPKT